jgi:NADPH:quinone reductase-like Zn-dependent oxidoreductase
MSLMPQNATFAEAASLIFGGQTAIYFLQKAGIPQRTHPKVLIIGATGSVGTSAVQIARHYGAEVTAVCSSAGQPLMQQLGVSEVILYDQTDFTQCRDRFDMVFDAVGKTTRQQCAHLLKSGGIYKTVGGMEYASESQEQMDLLKSLFELGHLKAIIDKSFPIDEVVAAHHYVDSGRKKGNVILQMST